MANPAEYLIAGTAWSSECCHFPHAKPDRPEMSPGCRRADASEPTGVVRAVSMAILLVRWRYSESGQKDVPAARRLVGDRGRGGRGDAEHSPGISPAVRFRRVRLSAYQYGRVPAQ